MKFNKYLYMAIGGAMTLMIAGAVILFAAPTSAAVFEQAPMAVIDVEDGVAHRGGPGRPGGGDQTFLLEELGVSQEEFDAAVAEAKEAAITDALNEGLITEEQAEQLRSGEGSRRFRGHGQAKKEYLAAALGISVEELDTAIENARDAALEQALVDGNITQEQYDLIQAREALQEFVDKDELMAEVLGVTAEELAAAKEEGTVRDLVEATGLSREELRAANQAAHEAAIDDAIEAGVITADQAEALQNARQNRRGGRGHGGRNGNFGPGTQGQNGGASAPAGLTLGSDA